VGRFANRRDVAQRMSRENAMQKLFKEIQQACSSGVWSRGVELVRADSVVGEREADDEIVLRVSVRGELITPVVTLYPEDGDWECTCKSQADPCEHVAAAAIALRQARKAGNALPAPKRPLAHVRYHLREESGELAFERELIADDELFIIAGSLQVIAKQRDSGPEFSASQQDILIEHALGSRRRGVLPRENMARLIPVLAEAPDVMLDEDPIQVSADPVLPQGRVVDAPGGVRLYVEQDPSITRIFSNGVVLCGDTLRAVGAARLTGRELEELPRGRFYPNDQLPELVTEILPSLEERIPVEITSGRLPTTTTSETPRIRVEVGRRGDALSVLATLVYGSPPCARVDSGRLVHLRGAIPVRDEPGERTQMRQLQSGLGLVPGRRADFAADDAIAFVERLALWRGEIEGDAHRAFYRHAPLVPSLSVSEDGFELAFTSAGDESDTTSSEGTSPRTDGGGGGAGAGEGTARGSATAERVIEAWLEGSPLIALSGGGFAPLPHDWLDRFGQRVADLLAARDEDGNLPACVLPDLGRLCEDLDEAPPPALQRLIPILEDFSGIEPAPLPSDLRAELRPYQRHGVDWLNFLRGAELGALLADDMGLGKTIQALCALRGRSLVVAPTSVLHGWAEEMQRFRPGLRFCLYHGAKRRLDPDAEVVLTSYAILRIDRDALTREHWQTVVLDEAQNIKNPESQVAQAAYRLKADFRVALTGTPVENRLEELWSQFHFLNPGLLGGRKDFQQRYAQPIGDGDAGAAERLRERIHPFVLRRMKREVAPELPPRTEVVLHCELSEEERQVYDAVRAASLSDAVAQLRAGGGVMAALEALLRMRQAACHPSLVPGQSAERSTKIELLVERLGQAMDDGHRALVFSQWTSLLDLVEGALSSADIDFTRLDGSTRDRGAVVSRFQSAEGPPVMLVSLKAGGTGLNLTAADHIFLLDPWWNPAVEDQAADRAHRIGQTRPVVVHRIVALDTVEEGILQLHARKRALSDAALDGVGAGEGLTREDLLGLLDA